MFTRELVAVRKTPARTYSMPWNSRNTANPSTHRSGNTSSTKCHARGPPCACRGRMSSTKCRRRRTEMAAPSNTTQKNAKRATSSDQISGRCKTRRFRTCRTTTAVKTTKSPTATTPFRRNIRSVARRPNLREQILEPKSAGDPILHRTSFLPQHTDIELRYLDAVFRLHLGERVRVPLGHQRPL